jgi:hypothetical protein
MSDSSEDEEIASQSVWISVSLASVTQLKMVFYDLLSLEQVIIELKRAHCRN